MTKRIIFFCVYILSVSLVLFNQHTSTTRHKPLNAWDILFLGFGIMGLIAAILEWKNNRG